jgi:5-formyltetrahydrofolate cyclo-ligase
VERTPCQCRTAFAPTFSPVNRALRSAAAGRWRDIARRPSNSSRAEKFAAAGSRPASGEVELSAREIKRGLRLALLQDRAALMASHADTARLAIRDRYLAAFDPPPGTVVSAFWPMPGELDLRPLLDALHARGCVCALPVVAGRQAPLLFRSWEPGVVLVTSRFGIAEPGPDRPEVRPQHTLVPLLAFDDEGYRLGYGGGFYDRTLAALRSDGAGPLVAIGVGLEAQRRPTLPREPFDERLDWLVTEEGVTRVAGQV